MTRYRLTITVPYELAAETGDDAARELLRIFASALGVDPAHLAHTAKVSVEFGGEQLADGGAE